MAKLREYGFSEYASRVYVALLELGRADAREASRHSRVPLAKIYATLRQLQENGLVEVHAESPRKYTPLPFAEFLTRVKTDHHERTAALERDIETASRIFPLSAAAMGTAGSGHVHLVRGRRNVLDKWRAQLRAAESEFLILAGDGFSQRLPNLTPAFQEFAARGGRARIIARDDAPMRIALRHIRGMAEVRSKDVLRTEHPDASITLFDRDSAMIAHLSSNPLGAQGEDFAILTDVPTAVGLLADILRPLWDKATPVVLDDVGGAETPRRRNG